jgi:hypothetical protein
MGRRHGDVLDDGDAGVASLDDEGGRAAAGAGEHDEPSGDGGVRDERLAPGEDVTAAVTVGLGGALHAGHVAAGLGLGEGEAAGDLAGGDGVDVGREGGTAGCGHGVTA